jgi:hypothetical protein
MIALFGPPPKELLAKSEAMAGFSWSKPIMNETGRLCKNGREYFNGPFFKENGKRMPFSEYPVQFSNNLFSLMGRRVSF